MKNKNKDATEKAMELTENFNTEIPSDVNGSYTGCPEDGKKPIQDADDL